MATGNSNFSTAILSTTLKNYRKTLENNIFKNIPLFYWLTEKGHKKNEDGGERIVVPLLYGDNTTTKAYSGYEVLDTTPQEGMTAAEYQWKQYSSSITISGREELQNAGKSRVINLLEAKTKQTEKSIRNKMDIDALSSNGDSATGMTGLRALVAVTPTTGTVGNIDRSEAGNTWWRNNSTASVGSFAAGGLDAMRTMYNTCSDVGQDFPDLILTTQTVFEYYEKVLQVQERFNDNKTADAGFMNLKFKGATMMFDPNVVSGYMYFLNSEYLSLVVHSGCDFKMRDFIIPENQDCKTALILWMGNMVMSNAARQGVLSGITA